MVQWIPVAFVLLSITAQAINAQAVNGGYSEWSAYTACSQTCGEGVVTRVRLCTNPIPSGGGSDCEGPDHEDKVCVAKKGCRPPEDVCKSGLDLHLMIDQSTSIPKGGLEVLLRKFLPAFVKKFKVSKKKTRVTISLFSRHHNILNKFNEDKSYKQKLLKKLIKDIPVQTFYGSRTWPGLKHVKKEVFSKRNGDRKSKQNVLVIFGDGNDRSRKPLSRIVEKLKVVKKCHIVAVGVGRKRKANEKGLRELAGDNVYLLKNAKAIGKSKHAKNIALKVCAVDGGYSKWSKWSDCSAACGEGVQLRQRRCKSPKPSKGGKDCNDLGPHYEAQQCNLGPCS